MLKMPKDLPKLSLSSDAVAILQKRYVLKDDHGKPKETMEQLFWRVASSVAEAERMHGADDKQTELAARMFYDLMGHLDFLPNSPTLANAGRPGGQLSACFVLDVPDDMHGIFQTVQDTAIIHKTGGGTGFNFSHLRPVGDLVKGTGGQASGVVSFMSVFNASTEVVKQGGMRRGANMGVLNVHHPELRSFIDCKQNLNEVNQKLYESFATSLPYPEAPEEWATPEEWKEYNDTLARRDQKCSQFKSELLDNQFANFNISVALTDDFMEALAKNGKFNVIHPKTGKTVGKEDAREIWNLLVEGAWRKGDPGIIFIDSINRANPTPELGRMEATNPCGEQPLLPNEACNLGSVNLYNMARDGTVDWDRLETVVRLAVRFLDDVIDTNTYPLPEIDKMVKANRKIGLGVMGFADLLYVLGIPYDSSKGEKLAREVMEFINRISIEESTRLAVERGVFPNWKGSVWEKSNLPMRNAATTTIAPTGTISMIAGVSSGCEPNFMLGFQKHVMDRVFNMVSPAVLQVARREGFYSEQFEQDIATKSDSELMPRKWKRVLVTAMDITPEWHVRIQAAFQEFTQNAVSKTVNFPNEATRADVERVYLMAYEMGCKGITVYRDGSKSTQPLRAIAVQDDEVKVVKKARKIKPRPRPDDLPGRTRKVKTGCGKLYLTVNHDEKKPEEILEVFVNAGSDGGCKIYHQGLSRMISLALRAGVDYEAIIDQLTSTDPCASFVRRAAKEGGMVGKSCPDVIGRVLKQFIDEGKADALALSEAAASCAGCTGCEEEVPLVLPRFVNPNLITPTLSLNPEEKCPECGAKMSFAEGCRTCRTCGFSKCS